jgi:hypothetical protein
MSYEYILRDIKYLIIGSALVGGAFLAGRSAITTIFPLTLEDVVVESNEKQISIDWDSPYQTHPYNRINIDKSESCFEDHLGIVSKKNPSKLSKGDSLKSLTYSYTFFSSFGECYTLHDFELEHKTINEENKK